MKRENKKTAISGLLIGLIVLLLIVAAVLLAILLRPDEPPDHAGDQTSTTEPSITEDSGEKTEEAPGLPLVTKYMVLSYPSELEGLVDIAYEELEDGQQIIFTTDLTGEELELFRFSISKSGTDGYQLGVLTDEEAGQLFVCMNVTEYSSGSWTPEEYAKLNAMQERVNDIIIQFYDDPRFTAARS